jgi:hypothetical protein
MDPWKHLLSLLNEPQDENDPSLQQNESGFSVQITFDQVTIPCSYRDSMVRPHGFFLSLSVLFTSVVSWSWYS